MKEKEQAKRKQTLGKILNTKYEVQSSKYRWDTHGSRWPAIDRALPNARVVMICSNSSVLSRLPTHMYIPTYYTQHPAYKSTPLYVLHPAYVRMRSPAQQYFIDSSSIDSIGY